MADDAAADLDRLVSLFVEKTKEHAVMLLDTQGRIVWWNRGAEQVFGMPSSEAVGQPLSRLFTPEEVERQLDDHELLVASKDSPAEDDRWLVRRDGSRFWATGVASAVRDANGTLLGFGKILRNRTDLKEQLEALRNRADVSDAAVRSKDVFLSTLSHEIRNPLAALISAVQLMRMTERLTPEIEHSIEIIERQTRVMHRLIDDLLDVSRVGAGKVKIQKREVELREVIDRALESAGPAVQERRHRLEVLLPSKPIVIEADAERIVQVFVNLIVNAAKYTPEGGRIWIKATVEGDEAVVSVEDTGIGITPEMLPRIFDLFTQVESSQPHAQGGLGIGLSLVKSLVTLHGGSVQVRSDGPGKGSEFSVRLPLTGTPPEARAPSPRT